MKKLDIGVKVCKTKIMEEPDEALRVNKAVDRSEGKKLCKGCNRKERRDVSI